MLRRRDLPSPPSPVKTHATRAVRMKNKKQLFIYRNGEKKGTRSVGNAGSRVVKKLVVHSVRTGRLI